MKAHFQKVNNFLVPYDPEAEKWLNRIKKGSVVSGEFKQVRNYQFHKKLFAMLNFAYDNWEPQQVNTTFGIAEKNFDRFRRDLIILAGYYKTVVRVNGDVRFEAESISFSNMDEETFEKLYNNVLNVIIKHIVNFKDMTAKELDNLIDEAMGYA